MIEKAYLILSSSAAKINLQTGDMIKYAPVFK